jgi:PAS domain S-box-containing protein
MSNMSNITTNHEDIKILKNIIMEMPCHVYWTDESGIYLGCNNMQAKFLGLSNSNDIIGKKLEDILYLGSKDTIDMINNVNKLVLAGEVVEKEENIIIDKKDFTFLSNKRPLYNSNNEIVGIIGVSVDITDRKQKENLELEKQKYLAQLAAQEVFKNCINNIQYELDFAKNDLLNKIIDTKIIVDKNNISTINLSKREGEILYLLSLGKNPKQIASIFTKIESKAVSPATVSSVISKQLYIKFSVFDLGSLLQKARVMNKIPFLHESFIGVL